MLVQLDFQEKWGLGLRGAIANVVREQFPQHYRTWPIVNSFNLRTYHLTDQYAVLIFEDRVSGIPMIGGIDSFPFDDHPTLPPKIEEIELWQFYLKDKFGLKEEDAAFLIPIKTSGGDSVVDDFALFSAEEKMFYSRQLMHVIHAYKAHLDSLSAPPTPNITNIISGGSNPRINMNSVDASTNLARSDSSDVFVQLRTRLDQIGDESLRKEIADSIDGMESAHDSGDFAAKYKEFISLTADHVALFAPFLPALSNLLG